jgi:hypothetical protein
MKQGRGWLLGGPSSVTASGISGMVTVGSTNTGEHMKIRLMILGIVLTCGILFAAFASVMTLTTLLGVKYLTTHVSPDHGVACVIWGSMIGFACMLANAFMARHKIRSMIAQSDQIAKIAD